MLKYMTSFEAFGEDQERRPRNEVLFLPSDDGEDGTDEEIQDEQDDVESAALENASVLGILDVLALEFGAECLALSGAQTFLHKLQHGIEHLVIVMFFGELMVGTRDLSQILVL